MIKLLIADDHTVVREGIIRIIEQATDLKVVAEAKDGFEVLEKARNNKVDVVILDMTMPGKSGLDIIKTLKTEHPKIKILVLSMHPEDQYELRVLKAGASAYLTKRTNPNELINVIRKVANGRKHISQQLAEKLAEDLDKKIEHLPHELLSDREFQIMCSLAVGKRIKEIAEELSLSAKTVSTYRERILQKMNLSSNAEITKYYLKHNLGE
ncbi:MAG: response regulator transcription factor [Ignavibacteria bacterium]|nr:response regulator transcription factor [Ignavibacteria bacterium]